MSSTDRQNRLLATEDWKRIYQSFRNAEFKSYDFDNLRRTMIAYLRENYPEDFNDYIESSEYLALIDMIAYIGQNFAFRVDLNARENYLELAERRESVLRLARLLSYNAERNKAANGLLKIDAVSTTENVRDSNNINLQGQSILWNDPANPNWREQFERVLNSSLPINGKIGNPEKDENINGVPTEQYRFSSTNSEVPVYGFSKTIDGRTNNYEIVSASITGNEILEEPPLLGRQFAFLYRDDGQGPASTNSGYFVHFRQGSLDFGDFTIDTPSTNETVAIDSRNVNNSDIWLYRLDENQTEQTLWRKVEAVEGNNVIYNSLARDQRNIYSVLTRTEDRISLIFADGTFGNLPRGRFRVYFRTSANTRLVISPNDMRNIAITIPYLSNAGKAEALTVNLSLKYTVDNSSVSESNDSIKNNAPATYYTQNRMITGEDYQISPLTISQEIIKTRSVNRTSSGISRYFDLIDATGKYSNTNLFGTDGIIYKDYQNLKTRFSFENLTDIEGEILNTVEPILEEEKLNNFYLDQFPRLFVEDLNNQWVQSTEDTNQSTGYFVNANAVRVPLGAFTASNMKFVKPRSLLKFESPQGFHFLNGKLEPGDPDFRGGTTYVWSKVVSVVADGTEEQSNSLGPVILNDVIPSTAKLTDIIPPLPNALTSEVEAQAIDQIFAFRTFGIRFARNEGEWRIITANDLDTQNSFSTGKTGDTTGQNLDSSWLLLFETDGVNYTVTYRTLRYVFESDKEIRFYFDSSNKIFDPITGKTVKDKITVLNINNQPDSSEPFNRSFDWEVVKEYRDSEGYVDSKKLEIGFFDSDEDGIIDNPDVFDELVSEETNTTTKIVVLERSTSTDGVTDFSFITNDSINLLIFQSKSDALAQPLSVYDNNQLFYYIDEDIFERFNKDTSRFEIVTSYRAKVGRSSLSFRYTHSADQNQRIDPSASNIIDTYLLTRGYDTEFRDWLDGERDLRPLPPSSDNLFVSYGQRLNEIKSISDEIIYHPVKYKVLFGPKAEPDLQAQFKIVKNPDLVLNDNEVKSRVISSINRFFALENWDFGDRFFFSELSSYVMNELSPDLVTFVVVPEQGDTTFGSLYEIKSESDEIFISGATVNDIDIIDEITADRLNAEGRVVTQTISTNTGIQSTDITMSAGGGTDTYD